MVSFGRGFSLAKPSSAVFTLSLLANLVRSSAVPPPGLEVKIGYPAATPAYLDTANVDVGVSPRPTQGPSYELMRRKGIMLERRGDLEQRDVTFTAGELIAYEAADQTCGYISGSLGRLSAQSRDNANNTIGAVATCPTGERCGGLALYALDGVPGPMFCCPTSGAPVTCTYQDACYNSAQVPSLCDIGCQANIDNILW
jgi:hypothetical protein